jgi:integrase
MSLSEIKARSAHARDKRYQLSDGDGLYLDVMPSGEKYWRYRYAKNGRRTWHTIGKYPAITLSDAREERNSLYRKLRIGVPIDGKGDSFRDVALQWLDAHDAKLSKERDKLKERSRLNNHLMPPLGDKAIRSITSADILAILQRLANDEKYEMLSRIRSIASQIFRFAIARGLCDNDPTYALRGAFIPPRKRHYPSIRKPAEVGALMRAITSYPYEQVRSALLFSALTFCRPGEVRHAEWSEISGDEWRIPEAKMKMNRPHIVPLSRQALKALEEMRDISGGGKYIFPSNRTQARPMSENTILAALRAMGYTKDQITPHGFRSMASTLLNENGFNRDWIERQLAHVEGNSVRAAYNYAEYLPERRKMMQWWADYLDALRQSAP